METVRNATSHGYVYHCCRVVAVNGSALYRQAQWEMNVEEHIIAELPPRKKIFIRFMFAVEHVNAKIGTFDTPKHITEAIMELTGKDTSVYAVDDLSTSVRASESDDDDDDQ